MDTLIEMNPLFNIFMNDIFYFIEICNLANYSDDNTLDHIACTIETVFKCTTKRHYKCY